MDESVSLPEGAAVEIALASPNESGNEEQGPSHYEHLKDFIGVVDDLPPDASVYVDHYLYGHPKR